MIKVFYCCILLHFLACTAQDRYYIHTNENYISIDLESIPGLDILDYFPVDKDGFFACGESKIYDSLRIGTIVKFNNDGIIDSSFGENGIATPFKKIESELYVIKVKKDKIYVGGCIYINEKGGASFALWRFNLNGQPDTTFGNMGCVISEKNAGDAAFYTLAFQSDDKIVALGSGSFYKDTIPVRTSILRYHQDGIIDTTFGNNGIIISNTEFKLFEMFDVTIDSKNRILVAGINRLKEKKYCACVWRIHPNGDIDKTFGKLGLSCKDDVSIFYVPEAIEVSNEGEIVLFGTYSDDNENNEDLRVRCFYAKLNENGDWLTKQHIDNLKKDSTYHIIDMKNDYSFIKEQNGFSVMYQIVVDDDENPFQNKIFKMKFAVKN